MIEHSLQGGRLDLTINRVDKANALTEAMLAELADRVLETSATVLVIRGAGNVFSAGADLEDVKNGTLATSAQWERLSGAIAGFKGFSVAALNGSCAGGALGMMLACDVRIAVPTAKFFYPVIKVGVLPQPSDPARMVALIGPSATKRMLLGAVRVQSPEALALGLIDQISEDVSGDVDTLVASALAADPSLVCAIKGLIPKGPFPSKPV